MGKTGIILIVLIAFCPLVLADLTIYNLMGLVNPDTGRPDVIRSLNQSGNQLILDNLTVDEIKVHNLSIKNPPAQCPANTGMIYFNGTNSICTQAIGYWNRSGTDLFLANTGDSVGIGTGSPTYNLQVAGNASINNSFYVIDGNVGIGTTTPGALLDVQKAGNGGKFFNFEASVTGGGYVFGELVNDGGTLRIGVDDDNGAGLATGALAYASIIGSESNTPLQLVTNGVAQVTILNDGNVGIGTTSPDARLELYGSTDIDHNLRITDTRSGNDGLTGINIGQIEFYTKDNDWDGGAGNVSASIAVVSEDQWANEQALVFRTGAGAGSHNIEKVRIQSDGNVGIGTTSPYGSLEVTGASPSITVTRPVAATSYGQIKFRDVNTTIWELGQRDGNTNLHFYNTASALDRMTIQTDGNLGIGTTSPSQKLVVVGDVNVTGNFTGNQIYGEMWYHNHTATQLNFAVDGTFYNLSFDNSDLNGFTFNDIGDYLETQVNGKYKTCYMASGDGQNNHMYFTTVLINGVDYDRCESHKKMTAGGDIVTMTGCCFIDLVTGDELKLATADVGGTGTGNYYSANVNLIRIGD